MEKLKQDDVLVLTIDGYGMDGEGVAHADNYVIFVPFAMKGEQVRAKVTYVKKNLVFCELKEVLRSSKERVTYDCNRFPRCGGCDLLHISYQEQLRVKKENVETLFRKNAGMDITVDEVVPSPRQLAYRNKIQLPFGSVNGKTAVGFFRETELLSETFPFALLKLRMMPAAAFATGFPTDAALLLLRRTSDMYPILFLNVFSAVPPLQ